MPTSAVDIEISIKEAADLLELPEPLVRQRIVVGALVARMVGSEARVHLSDVLRLKEDEAPIRRALEDLRDDTEDLMARGL